MGKKSRKKQQRKKTPVEAGRIGGLSDGEKLRKILRHPATALAILALAIGAAYVNSLHVPFYLDDYSSIRNNPQVYQWRGLAPIARANPRFLGYLTFALNYRFHQLDVVGYHVVNLFIHILASWAVWWLLRLLLETPRVQSSTGSHSAHTWLPLTVALIFGLHPLQTQAVTYVVQRLASLAALFYLTGLACYLRARLAGGRGAVSTIFYATALVCFVAALFTKQNAATFPLAVLAVELLCFHHTTKQTLGIFLGVATVLIIAWVLICAVLQVNPLSFHMVDRLSRETQKISRLDYFLTQLKVLWNYFRLAIYPVGQHLDYDVTLETNPFSPLVLAAAVGHLALLALAWRFRRRAPLLSLGIFFTYIAHLVESSIIPIDDLAFEHRTYLPNVGLFLALTWVLWHFVGQRVSRRARLAALACLVVILGWATWQRNTVWNNPILFWAENVKWAPGKSRPKVELASQMLKAGHLDEAIALLKAAAIRDEKGRYHFSDPAVLNLTRALHLKGKDQKALEILDTALQHRMHPVYHSQALAIKAQVLLALNRAEEALKTLRESLKLFPGNEDAYLILARIYRNQGRIHEAAAAYRKVLEKNPTHRQALQAYRRLLESGSINPPRASSPFIR